MVERKVIFKTDKYSFEVFDMSNFDDFCQLNQDPIVSKYVNHNGGKPKTFRECVEKYNDITYGQENYGYSYWAVYDNTNPTVKIYKNSIVDDNYDVTSSDKYNFYVGIFAEDKNIDKVLVNDEEYDYINMPAIGVNVC